jgi:subtilisin family serine protease
MARLGWVCSTLASAAAIALLASAAAFGACEPIEDDRVPNQILLETNPGASISDIEQRYGVRALDSIPEYDYWKVEVLGGQDVDEVVSAMKKDPDIRSAEPHRHMEAPEGVQRSIPILDAQATTDTFRNQPAAAILHTSAAHARYTGAGVTVAVVDTAQSLRHPETAGEMAGPGLDLVGGGSTAEVPANGLDDDQDGLVDESDQHGTHIAGLVSLAAPGARIYAIRVLEEDGKGDAFTIAKGILRAIQGGVDVINLSFTMTHDSRAVERAVEDALDSGIVVVAATGNRGLGCVEFPAWLGEVVAVAAVGDDLVRAPFSNYGLETDLSAPGVDLLSTYGSDSYARWSGTSFATPLVAGAAALLLEKYPGLSPAEVEQVLRDTTQPDNNPADLAGLMGTGVVDLDRVTQALTADRTSLKLRQDPAGTVLAWSPVKDATTYDVVRGDLASLRLVGETVELGPLHCVARDTTATDTASSPDPDLPAPGQAFFYLFRDDATDAGGGSYGADSDGHPRIPGPGDC